MSQRVILPTAAHTDRLGAALGNAMPADAAGAMLTLKGDLGAGKTALVRALLGALGHIGPVPSPTYTLIEPYEILEFPIYHVDLYRVLSIDELEFLGWEDLRAGLALVEWPERAPAFTAAADLSIELHYLDTGREAILRPSGPKGDAWVAKLQLSEVLEQPF
ncbi:MAG: tRNA (adenosine(37)-N6)-threonylcarbamoyltransferase complex ATPase subunit type 1 TsaE [Pseudomonadota bacterium]